MSAAAVSRRIPFRLSSTKSALDRLTDSAFTFLVKVRVSFMQTKGAGGGGGGQREIRKFIESTG